jgi:predicted lipoprotein with Yx(FWY)xxD motif
MSSRRTNINSTTFLAGAAAVALSALVAVGCGGAGDGASAASATASGHTVGTATGGELGTILVDPKGRTLYGFNKDTGPKSACFGACAVAWPPLRATGKPTVGAGADASLVGTTARSDGMPQVTYSGRPLYLYAGDEKAGDIRGQGLTDYGASWYALTRGGNQVPGQASSSYGSSPGGGGSY